jgi:NitT/TauT family transport system permease protein
MTSLPTAFPEAGLPSGALPPRRRASLRRVRSPAVAYWRNERLVVGILALLVGLLAWQGVTLTGRISPLLLSPPGTVRDAFVRLVSSGELERHLWITLQECLVGFPLSVLLSVPLAILAGWRKRVGWALDPLMAVLYTTPTIAFFPLLMLIFDIGLWDKAALVVLSAGPQIYITIVAGVRATEERFLRLGKSFGASEGHLLRTIVLPSLVPFLSLAVRLAATRSLVYVVTGELLAARGGLGFIISFYGNQYRMGEMFVAVIVVVAFGVLLNQLLLVFERRFESWRPAVGAR